MIVPIRGMMCAGCVSRIEETLRRQNGVIWATVNYAAEEATIIADPSVMGLNKLANLIQALGFEVPLPQNEPPALFSRIAGSVSRGSAGVASFLAGVAGVAFLVALYLGLVTLAQGWQHAKELLWRDRWLVSAIAGGLAVQLALYVHLRQVMRSLYTRAPDGRLTAAGRGDSSAEEAPPPEAGAVVERSHTPSSRGTKRVHHRY
jgi:cation transport ATPase